MDETLHSAVHVAGSPDGEDTPIAEQVARSIDETGRFGPRQLRVSATEGVVTLRGRVSSYYQKQMAQAAALRVEGVRRLVNRLKVY